MQRKVAEQTSFDFESSNHQNPIQDIEASSKHETREFSGDKVDHSFTERLALKEQVSKSHLYSRILSRVKHLYD